MPELNWNPEGKRTLLSIDGGGMRGVIAVAMLAELELMTERPAYQLFDMVGGTSTGAIIAAGLGLHVSAKQLLDDVYRQRLPRAFASVPRGLGFWLRYLSTGLRYVYALEPFVAELLPFVEGKKVGDFSAPIVYMTTKDVRTGSTYYVVSAGAGRDAFKDWPVSGAVAASGSAPLFFPPVVRNLVDGGVGAYGNPCLGAAIEATKYIGWSEENVLHVSLGTGYPPNEYPDGLAASWWLKDWVNYLIIEGIEDSALQQVYMTRAVFPKMDFRRYNPYLTAQSISDSFGIPTQGGPDPAAIGLDSIAPAEIELMEKVGRAYARAIDWNRPNALPWETKGGHPQPHRLPVNWQGTIYR